MIKITTNQGVKDVPTNPYEFVSEFNGVPDWNVDIIAGVTQVPWKHFDLLDLAIPVYSDHHAADTHVFFDNTQHFSEIPLLLTLKALMTANYIGRRLGLSARIAAIKAGDFDYLRGIKA